MVKLYRQVKLSECEQDDFVFPHKMAMTGESLHSKSEIAYELGLRDKRIAELEKRLSHAETMSDKEQSIRDLEQQAIACDWIYKNVSDLSNRNYKAIKSQYCQLRIKSRNYRISNNEPTNTQD
jgi:ABC-type phosphate transport system auxiliary subunit